VGIAVLPEGEVSEKSILLSLLVKKRKKRENGAGGTQMERRRRERDYELLENEEDCRAVSKWQVSESPK